ncbi:unnamed protein product [Arctia plantaginis]|uniref:Carboxylesterase type B domain-containing protein n=1 Tax=Arctia plantaginis TaxID=874455 RepID=A0A8S1BKW2_ARCPL|nr:unnamed protein product [Arctia plantaginis]
MSEPIVETEQGKLRGQLTRNDDNGFTYYAFKGVPYAKPPIGELRFSVPQPPQPWEGIRDATKTCNICAQFSDEMETVMGDEDCLYLNVYTPKLPSSESELLPVMVYFHGGGFILGSGTDAKEHGPEFLIDKNVVIVSLNYRLSILGFLSLDRKEAPGNMGLMDQVQALKWVQKNIANFCGNPNNVTIFGISAGGASVGYLMLSPMAEGLFHKVIAQSGSPLLHWAINTDVKKLASKIPATQNKNISDDEQLLTYLKDMTTVELISASKSVIDEDEFRGGIHFGFVPTIEKLGDWEPFLTESPYQLLAQGKFTKVPYMSGFCTREGLLMVPSFPATLKKLIESKSFVDFFPFDLNKEEKRDIQIILKKIYLEGEKTHHDADSFAIDFFTDVDFLGGVYVSAKLIAKYNKPVYFYEFSYDGKLNFLKVKAKIEREGACHADEGGYILKNNLLPESITDIDAVIRDRMTTMWTNFATCGNPTPELDHLIPMKWETMTENVAACLVIDKAMKMKYEVCPQRLSVFEELYAKKCGIESN